MLIAREGEEQDEPEDATKKANMDLDDEPDGVGKLARNKKEEDLANMFNEESTKSPSTSASNQAFGPENQPPMECDDDKK